MSVDHVAPCGTSVCMLVKAFEDYGEGLKHCTEIVVQKFCWTKIIIKYSQ